MDIKSISSPAFPMLKILIQGSVQADVFFSSQLLGDRFFRLNPILPEPIDLDEYTQIPRLVILAENFDLTSTINWINQNWF